MGFDCSCLNPLRKSTGLDFNVFRWRCEEIRIFFLAVSIGKRRFSVNEKLSLNQGGKVVYTSKDGRPGKCFPAPDRLAAMSSPIPKWGEEDEYIQAERIMKEARSGGLLELH